MLFLIYMLVANSCVPQFRVANFYRMNFGGIQIGTWEISMLLGVIAAVLVGSRRTEASRRHPAMMAMMILLGLGFVAGVVGDLLNNATLKDSLPFGREYAA